MRLSKKFIVAGAGVLGALGLGTAAFAFFNTSASGTGQVNVSAALEPVSLNAGLSDNALIPNSPVPVLISVTNPNNAQVRLGKISITSVKIGTALNDNSLATKCPLALTGSDSPTATHTVAAGANGADLTGEVTTPFKITLGDADEEQTPCLSAVVTIVLSAAAAS